MLCFSEVYTKSRWNLYTQAHVVPSYENICLVFPMQSYCRGGTEGSLQNLILNISQHVMSLDFTKVYEAVISGRTTQSHQDFTNERVYSQGTGNQEQ